jgi:hypothetical protein
LRLAGRGRAEGERWFGGAARSSGTHGSPRARLRCRLNVPEAATWATRFSSARS